MHRMSRASRYALPALIGFAVLASSCSYLPAPLRNELDRVSPGLRDRAIDAAMPGIVDRLGPWALKARLVRAARSKSADDRQSVQRVADRIIDAARRGAFAEAANKFQWEVTVVESDDINAFAVPGGKIAVYSGLIRFAKQNDGRQDALREDWLAVALSHEMIHALARHATQRMSRDLKRAAFLALEGKQLADGGLNPAVAAGVMGAMGMDYAMTAALPYQRDQESEADHAGLILMAQAGYDPTVAAHFWKKRTQYTTASKLPAFLALHPSDDTRIAQIIAWTPEAVGYMQHRIAERAPVTRVGVDRPAEHPSSAVR